MERSERRSRPRSLNSSFKRITPKRSLLTIYSSKWCKSSLYRVFSLDQSKTTQVFEDKFLQSHLHMVPGSGSKMQVPIVPFPTKNITPGVTRYKGLMGNQGRDNDKVRKAL